MKKVLLIISELGKGGAERSISLLSYYLEKENYDVTLCILSGTGREKYYKTCTKVIFIDPPAGTSVLNKITAWKYRINKLKALKEKEEIDVSISFLEGPDYANVLTKGKDKVVLSIRGSKIHDKFISGIVGKARIKLLIPMLYKKANELVCVTKALAEEMHNHFGIPDKRIKTIYNFYEEEIIKKLSNEQLTEEEKKIFSKPVIINSGRLHIQKEQDKLIRILHRVKQKNSVRLMILGDGELKDKLILLAEELGLKACDWATHPAYEDADIYLMGFQTNAFKFYKHSSLFALTSSWEGFPNVLAEALICNIPVVTTDCYTGPREILNIEGLGEAINTPIRTPVGSLLPMVNELDDSRMQAWINEIDYWLKAEAPHIDDFTKMTQRFTLAAMMEQWKEVINN